MTHDEFSFLIDKYLAGRLSGGEKEAMDNHLADCPDCRLALRIREDSLSLDEGGEVPAAFTSNWQRAVYQEEAGKMETIPTPKKARIPFQFRRWMAVAAALVFVFGGTLLTRDRKPEADSSAYDMPELSADASGGFGGGDTAEDFMARSAAPEMAADVPQAAPLLKAAEAQDSGLKIIRTVSISLTTRAFDKDLQLLSDAVKARGGYIEYSDISAAAGTRRYASLTARIPKDQLDGFLADAQGYGQLSAISQSQEDVSENYQDVDNRLKTQTAKMSRLQDLLLKATTVEDILSIENEIANTQYQIDSLTGSLRGMDSRVDYSTVRLDLSEQTAPTLPQPLGLRERILNAVSDAWQAVKAFCEDVLVFLVVILPYAAALAALFLIARVILKRRKK